MRKIKRLQRTHWHLYGLQCLPAEKLVKAIEKIAREEVTLIK
jgi:hypothetical protein